MVHVTIRRDSQARLSSLFARGHAGWADAGEDVVCAAVSGIIQAAWLGLERVAKVEVNVERGAGVLALRWPVSERSGVPLDAIVTTAELALEQIAEQYPAHVHFSRETEA